MKATEPGPDPGSYLQQLASQYEAAGAIARQLIEQGDDNARRDALLQNLNDNLSATARLVEQNAAVRRHLLSEPKSDAVAQQLERVQALIEDVLQTVQTAEQRFVAARAQLTPQLDERTKARQVRAAYGATLRDAAGG